MYWLDNELWIRSSGGNMCTYILDAPNYHPCCVECRRNSTKALAVQVFGAGDLSWFCQDDFQWWNVSSFTQLLYFNTDLRHFT